MSKNVHYPYIYSNKTSAYCYYDVFDCWTENSSSCDNLIDDLKETARSLMYGIKEYKTGKSDNAFFLEIRPERHMGQDCRRCRPDLHAGRVKDAPCRWKEGAARPAPAPRHSPRVQALPPLNILPRPAGLAIPHRTA